jgi:ribonuclease III family protein
VTLDLSFGFLSMSAIASESQQMPAQSDIQRVSPAALAYLGDSVYELYVRTRCLLPPSRLRDYHHQVVAHVRAEAQAEYLRSLLPHLTPPELEIVRQGRNAATSGPKRIDPELYQLATSLEALLGFLYLTDQPRLGQIFQRLDSLLTATKQP